MNYRTINSTASLGWLRRLFFFYLLAVMVVLEVAFALTEFVGLSLNTQPTFWLVSLIIPGTLALAASLLEGKREAAKEPERWGQWAWAGMGMFFLWAGAYFLVGRLTDPGRVRFLSSALESHIPLRPAYSLLYVLLYPIFILPYFVVRERAVFARLVAANLLMFVFCSTAFLLVPVALDRQSLPFLTDDFCGWLLMLIRGVDPSWNCLPSEHCTASLIAALAIWESNRRIGAFAVFSALLIGVSTLFTKQHYLVDVFAGYGLAVGIYWALRWSRSFEAITAIRQADS